MITLNFAKGHGTRNDFVILVDRDAMVQLSDEQVSWLCDRRGGIGGDGLLRAVQARHIDSWTGDPDLWFMDYRNADGSVAQMCGNGLRVFARHLIEQGLVGVLPVEVGTRAGLRTVSVRPDGDLRASMGPAVVSAEPTWVRHGGVEYRALAVDVGNPHAVVQLADAEQLAALDLSVAPKYDEAVFPEGVNVEFVVPNGPDDLSMRVHERGSGETQSCGTGVVASAAAQLYLQGRATGTVAVTVPGGRLSVDVTPQQAHLTGPAVVVAHGTVVLPF